MNNKKIFLALFFSITVSYCFADKYPRNYSIDIIHYAFELRLSDSTDEIIGKATIRVLFKKTDILQVRLDLVNKTEQRAGKGMAVESVTYNNMNVGFIHKNDELLIQLGGPAEKDKIGQIVIEYKGVPADALRIGPTKYGDRSFFCENWPNRARHWLPTVDHPYDKATCEFMVTAPSRYKVISNGLLQEESQINKDFKLTHWKQSVPVSCWLFVLGVAEFAVQNVDQFDGKLIQTWVYPKDREAGFYDFANPTKQVLQYYSDYIGPFVYEKLANIQTPSVNGGMETSSAIFYGENLVNGKADERLKDVVIHEIAHQWFGNAVTESTWDDAWLSEGLATYFTLLFQEHTYGHEKYIDGLKKAKKSIASYYKKDSTFSIVDNRSAETGPVTSGITYQKGAWVLHMLRELIGPDKFQKGIRAYYKKYLNANATTNDFIGEMEKASGKKLKSFFYQWLNRPGVLKIAGDWEYDARSKQIILNMEQLHSGEILYDMPLEIQVFEEGSNKPGNLKFTINKKSAQFKIHSLKRPALLVTDPNTSLLADIDLKEKQQ